MIKEEIQDVVDEHLVNLSDDKPELDLEPRTKTCQHKMTPSVYKESGIPDKYAKQEA